VAKNWWDQRKTGILGEMLWGNILEDIILNKFAKHNQRNALLEILRALFYATVQYANTKRQPLIPNGTIKHCKKIKTLLYNLDHAINIDEWLTLQINQQKALNAKQNKTRKRVSGNAKAVAEKLRLKLVEMTNAQKRNEQNSETYDQAILHLADKFMSNNAPNQTNQNVLFMPTPTTSHQYNQYNPYNNNNNIAPQNNNNPPIIQISVPPPNIFIINNVPQHQQQPNTYDCCHASSTLGNHIQRYNPMRSTHSLLRNIM